MQAEADLVFHLIETEFQKLSLPKQKELLQSLIGKLGMNVTEKVTALPVSTEGTPTTGRVLGLHKGQGWISDDFNDELPDEFWGGGV